MGHRSNNIGKYQFLRTIGGGTFAKVKLAVDSTNNQYVAIKVIDKHMVMQSNLKSQVQREIKTMRLLHHPNIIRIHEVIGTKTKIYIVMDYVSGGQLTDKLSYEKKLNEYEARKLFQQLVDAVDHCHNKGVYHRDLKPENLLLDNKGNVKVSDFGLSALRKRGELLSTACGSPCYVAPELLTNRGYDGAAADIWSCGVILFEMLSGTLPFDDRNLINLYKKIYKAEYKFPTWFTESQKRIISRILDPNPKTRITAPEIGEDAWFQIDYEPAYGYECDGKDCADEVRDAFESVEEAEAEQSIPKSSSFINAFQLIAMSHDLDLSGLFEEQDEVKEKVMLVSDNTLGDTMTKIQTAAADVNLSVDRCNNKLKMHPSLKMTRCSRSYFSLSAEVIEVAPLHCVIEISKSAGELGEYKEFCRSLSNLLKDDSGVASPAQEC
ncbi:CBL-interacting serine/threonine-protein kinase 21-like [Punica granatum]|uniref:non-specific serine/threonine protein kinase n=1 Tax=Punica granatum TaxID=22663 RepID=A0A6P8CFP9_PUNGR|nr:CBL-interacting serine/threonine-protein kinase 21-like [Punica granatum]